MRWGFLLLGMATGLVLGGAGSWATQTEPAAPATSRVLTVTEPLPARALLTEANTAWAAWPKAALPPAALTEEVSLPLVADRDLEPGKPLQRHHAHPPITQTFFLPEGYGVGTFTLGSTASVGAFLPIGSRADLEAFVASPDNRHGHQPAGRRVWDVVVVDVGHDGEHTQVTLLATDEEMARLRRWSTEGPIFPQMPGCDFAGDDRWHGVLDMEAWRRASYVRWCQLVDGSYVDLAGRHCEEGASVDWPLPELVDDPPHQKTRRRGANCRPLAVVEGGVRVVRRFDETGQPCDGR